MKKTLTVNLNGRVFNIDEDAYQLLENYLSNLRSYFGEKPDTAEIISDFEARIEELFSEKIKSGYEVVSIELVEAVIKRMGNPEDLGDETIGTEKENATSDNPQENKSRKKFYRNIDDKKLGGVCSGIAAYFGWDPLPVRFAFVLLVLLSTGWLILFYLILWILMPEALTASQKLEMKGEPVTLENIGKTVSETITSVRTNEIESFFSAVFKIWVIVFGCIIGLPLLIVFLVLVTVLIAMIFGAGNLFFMPVDFLGFDWGSIHGAYPVIGIVSLIVIIGIPLSSIVYSIFSSKRKVSSSSKKMKLVGLLIWIIALATFLFSGVQIAKQYNWNIPWSIYCSSNRVMIKESGKITDRYEDLPGFEVLKLDDNLIADVCVRQEVNKKPKMVIHGDENIIDKIAWKMEDGKLELFVENGFAFNCNRSLTIFITTPEIKGVIIDSFGKVTTENKIDGSGFEVKINGSGSFYSDSLYCPSVSCNLNGAGKITVGGEAENVQLFVSGVGEIDAKNLEARSILTKLKGVGSIKCNPVESLDASVDGVGKITYKNEPENKKTSFNGVGKIEREE